MTCGSSARRKRNKKHVVVYWRGIARRLEHDIRWNGGWWRCARCLADRAQWNFAVRMDGGVRKGARTCRPIQLARGQNQSRRRITGKRAAPPASWIEVDLDGPVRLERRHGNTTARRLTAVIMGTEVAAGPRPVSCTQMRVSKLSEVSG